MSFSKTIITAAALAMMGAAVAAPTADEIKQLGTTLTPWGAVKAGNKEGTIPEYTGGVTNPPKYDYKTGVSPDPYPDDKVLFWIDAKNMDKYADKLSPGVQAMIKKSPATMRLAVYPTRRSASYPQNVSDNSIKNTTRCSLQDGGNTLDVSKGCRGGFPFPIPKNANEAMWNHTMYYRGVANVRFSDSYMVKPSGQSVMVTSLWSYEDNQFYDPDTPVPWRNVVKKSEYVGPTRQAGNATLFYDDMRGVRSSWSYSTASRRIRLAPDQAADTPIASTGGSLLYDQVTMFSGTLARFDWKLLGRKEMYIPYNNYRLIASPAKECTADGGMLLPYHPNPNCVRWELHRVWHVQGTLKQDKRHLFGKRDYYWDEDSYIAGLGEGYDHGGKLYIVQWAVLEPDYVKHVPASNADFSNFDLNSGTYFWPIARYAWALDKPIPGITSSDSMATFVMKPPN